MNEQQCLSKMIPPGKHRPGKMGGGGVMQIHLTRACSQACYGCTQGSNLGGKPSFITLENFEIAVRSMEGYPWLIALFGGQPTLHPEFPEICKILSRLVPVDRRGLWTNALNGHGSVCRSTFLPHNCNLNVHLSQKDYDEFRRDWPEVRPVGLECDSRHAPPFVAMKDVVPDESERWRLISECPINIHWSAMIGQFRGQPRAWVCEIMGSQAMLHQDNPDYPDTGIVPVPGWWRIPMHHPEVAAQVRHHCHDCGVPLQGYGELSQSEEGVGKEQVSATHQDIFKPKRKGRRIELVTVREQLGKPLELMTDYLGNAKR